MVSVLSQLTKLKFLVFILHQLDWFVCLFVILRFFCTRNSPLNNVTPSKTNFRKIHNATLCAHTDTQIYTKECGLAILRQNWYEISAPWSRISLINVNGDVNVNDIFIRIWLKCMFFISLLIVCQTLFDTSILIVSTECSSFNNLWRTFIFG